MRLNATQHVPQQVLGRGLLGAARLALLNEFVLHAVHDGDVIPELAARAPSAYFAPACDT
jgi:hypothetical protein